ncbi:hypothetical protein [Sphingobium sp.]|uniref:hypothetical protein n=1 Tax=Sphingobium sp. TaxID=1912891 RepID=UPI003B3AF7B5
MAAGIIAGIFAGAAEKILFFQSDSQQFRLLPGPPNFPDIADLPERAFSRVALELMKSAGIADDPHHAENKRKWEHHPVQSDRMMREGQVRALLANLPIMLSISAPVS